MDLSRSTVALFDIKPNDKTALLLIITIFCEIDCCELYSNSIIPSSQMPPKRGRPARRNRVLEEDVGPPPPQGTFNAADAANIVAHAINAAMTAVAQQMPTAQQRAQDAQAPT